jgi:DNA modification methylase
VLRDDGTLWLNLGDSYAANRSYQVPSTKGGPKHSDSQAAGGKASSVPDGLKPKDLIGIPWRVAFALQADGWYLRQDIIWHKPNPMPESVRDRCTKAHEYVFLLSKSERYFFDAEAMKEPSAQPERAGKLERSFSTGKPDAVLRQDVGRAVMRTETRNRRSVWTVATRPYKGAHFATFPPALIEPCILAGAPFNGLVLDPFTGSGTTAAVALQHGRRFIGCELNPDYIKLAEARIAAAEAEVLW